jgi:hypothetical protein
LVVISLMECLGEIQQLTTGLKSMVLWQTVFPG